MFSRSLNSKCEVHVSSERTTNRKILIELQYTEQSTRWAAPARPHDLDFILRAVGNYWRDLRKVAIDSNC